MAGATGTSALEANTKLGGWMNEPPSLKRTAFWHPENGGDSKFGSFKLPVFVFSWGELLVSGSVSPYSLSLRHCFFQQVVLEEYLP